LRAAADICGDCGMQEVVCQIDAAFISGTVCR